MGTALLQTVARVAARTVTLLQHPESLLLVLSKLLWHLEQLRRLVLQLMAPAELRMEIPSAATGIMATAAPCMDFGKYSYERLAGCF